MNITNIIKDKLYNCIKCENKFFIEPVVGHPDEFKVECNMCNTSQCVNCGVEWNTNHDKVMCSTYKKTYMFKDSFMDNETKKLYDKEGIILCPGECGHALSITYGCNVLKCVRDKIYVCALCGEKLDSSDFDVNNVSHNNANKHYWDFPNSKCYKSLFVTRDEWLKTNAKKH